MSETTETTKPETQSEQVTAPIVEETNNEKETSEAKIEDVKTEESQPPVEEAKLEEVKEHIEVVPSDAPLNVTEKIQQAEHNEKSQEITEEQTVTEESKSKESVAEVAVNDESLKVESKSEQTISEEKSEDKVVTKRTTRGRVSRTAKSGNAVSTESVEVVEEKNPVEQKVEEKQIESEEKVPATETPKRGRGRQPKRKATTPPQKTETKKTKIESPSKEEHTHEEEETHKDKDVPLLEQSLTVEGKRQRKTTQRLELNVKESSSKHSYTPQGKGKALGDIPRICHFIDKTTGDKMRQLYRLCMGYNPKHKEIKKNLKTFNGFDFDRESTEFEKKSEFLEKVTVSGLKQMCDLLDLERSGTKEVLVERILDFLMEPVDSGRPVPAPKAKGRGRGRPSKSKTPTKKFDESMDVDESEEGSEDEQDNSKSEADQTKNGQEDDEDEDEEKEEDEQKSTKQNGQDKDGKVQQPPTEEELKTTIKEIIDKANLDKVTMKKVIQDVYAQYPDHNLNDQKNVIKKIVKELLEVQ